MVQAPARLSFAAALLPPCLAAAQLVPGLAAALRSLLPHVALLPLNLTALNNKCVTQQ